MPQVVDLSMTIHTGMWRCGDETEIAITQFSYAGQDSDENMFRLDLNDQAGTRCQVPYFVDPNGKRIIDYGPERFFGAAYKIVVADAVVTPDILAAHRANLAKAPIVVLQTEHMDFLLDQSGPPIKKPVIQSRCADLLADLGVAMVAMDCFTFESQPHFAIHKEFFKRDILLVEKLVGLKCVPATFQFYAAPLKLAEVGSSPVRAFAVFDENPA